MIPYMVGKLAPNSSYLTRGLVKFVPGRSYFRAVPYQNGDKWGTGDNLVCKARRRVYRVGNHKRRNQKDNPLF